MLQLYEDVRECFKNDFLFWLQFGMAHIRAGNLDVAENYLNQSLNIYPKSFQTLHHLGVLYLLQAQSSENPAAMVAKAEEGMDMLREQRLHRSDDNSYAYHAYLTHVSRWYDTAGDIITLDEWEALRKVGNEARAKYRLDDRILEAANELETLICGEESDIQMRDSLETPKAPWNQLAPRAFSYKGRRDLGHPHFAASDQCHCTYRNEHRDRGRFGNFACVKRQSDYWKVPCIEGVRNVI